MDGSASPKFGKPDRKVDAAGSLPLSPSLLPLASLRLSLVNSIAFVTIVGWVALKVSGSDHDLPHRREFSWLDARYLHRFYLLGEKMFDTVV